ncbi:MAG: DNA primase [Nitrosomonadales bacterium]|nr:DNA primase [Nitrosomonadales bacterium]
MIPESFIQELLSRIDVVDVIDKRIPLKKAGANFVACCPFHQEKTPSFTVSPSKQFYHCFGCGEHGSAISFLIEYEGLSFVEAVNELANSIGLKVPNDAPPKLEKNSEYTNLEHAIKTASIFYQKQLRESPEAISYLKARGLTGQVAKDFSIGYAPNDWQNLKNAFKNYEDEILIKSGLVVKNDKGKFYDRFRHRIIFPIYSDKGSVIGFGGRIINPEDTPKYYNSPETALFQKSYELYGLLTSRKSIREKGYVLVVEGYMDVVGLAQKGLKNVVATLGTATTAFHIKKLIRYTQEIIFCFDGDAAGRSAAWRAMNNSLESVTDNMQLKFLFLPDGHDPDSFVRENSIDEFELLAKEAIPLTEYIIKYLTINNDLATQEKKVKFLNEIEPIFKQLTAQKLSLLFKKRISELINLNLEEINQILKIKNTYPKKNSSKIPDRLPISSIRKFCLLLILRPDLIKQEDSEFFISEDIDDKLVLAIIEMTKNNGDYNSAMILHFLETRFDKELIKQIHLQLSTFNDEMEMDDEINALRVSIKKRYNSFVNKQKLNETTKKSLDSLSDEEKEFLKNIGKG